jgi:hypothetical protein
MFSNLDQSLRKEAGGDMSSSQDNQKYVGFLTNMFKAMRSDYEVRVNAPSLVYRMTLSW